jgi:hypothetical protein
VAISVQFRPIRSRPDVLAALFPGRPSSRSADRVLLLTLAPEHLEIKSISSFLLGWKPKPPVRGYVMQAKTGSRDPRDPSGSPNQTARSRWANRPRLHRIGKNKPPKNNMTRRIIEFKTASTATEPLKPSRTTRSLTDDEQWERLAHQLPKAELEPLRAKLGR